MHSQWAYLEQRSCGNIQREWITKDKIFKLQRFYFLLIRKIQNNYVSLFFSFRLCLASPSKIISLPKYDEIGLTCVPNWPPARKELRFAWTIFNIIWVCYFTWYSWKKKKDIVKIQNFIFLKRCFMLHKQSKFFE